MTRLGQRFAAIVAVSLLLSITGTLPVSATSHRWGHHDARVCVGQAAGEAACLSIARAFYLDGTKVAARTRSELASLAAAAAVSYFNGTSLRTAYGITAQGDPSRVVAIVDAYDDPAAYANLARFRADSGLPPIQSCTLETLTSLSSTAASPCFTKTDQAGGTSLPAADAGWSNEIDLDLAAASSICPRCSILLLEAASAYTTALATAVTTASNTPHVLAISNSYGISGDFPGAYAPAYDNAAKKGLAVTASAGDGGYGPMFPASATNVIGVGGTSLFVSATTGARTSETVWGGTGSGCSVYNTAPSWQSIPGNPCGGRKAISDLSADADPGTGLAIYTTYAGVTGYWVFGGTSLSAPIIAALYTMQGGYGGGTLAGQFAWAAGTPYFDVTSGSNGTCSPSLLCTAGPGWDGPTGRGSIALASAVVPDFSLSVSPASAAIRRGGTASYTVTVMPSNGFAGAISLSLTGQPSGSIVTFTPNPTTGTSILTVKTRQSTAARTYALTITGVSGSLRHSVGASLTVTK